MTYWVLRVPGAIACGVVSAAVLNGAIVAIGTAIDQKSAVFGGIVAIPMVAILGVIFTFPAWAIFCALALPYFTLITYRGGYPPRHLYFGSLALLGAIFLVAQVDMLHSSLDPDDWAFVIPQRELAPALLGGVLGAIGGLCIGWFWRITILRPLADHVGETGDYCA